MVINLMSLTPASLQLFEHLVGYMLDYYQIPRSSSACLKLAEDGQIQKVCDWLKKHKHLSVTPFRFESRTHVLAYGIEIDPCPHLAKELLKM
jgi:hypothetical protein